MSRLIAQFVAPLSLILFLGCGSVETQDLMPDGGDDVDAGDVSSDASDVDDDSGPVDTIAPTVVSTFPTNNSEGIDADAVILVKFSEAMDTASVETAWVSEKLPAKNVSFDWNEEGNELTLTPVEPLPLAEGTGLDPTGISAVRVSLGIGVAATDLAGNPLDSPLMLDFSTKRRMTVDLVQILELTRSMRDDDFVFSTAGSAVAPGDDTGNRQVKVFAGFEMPNFPSGAELESASLEASQNSAVGNPFSLGPLSIFHINAATINPAAFDDALSDVGVFSTDEVGGIKQLDVLTEFQGDLTNRTVRGDRTQYRLEFPTATNSDNQNDNVRFSRSSISLLVTYLSD